MIYLEGFRVLNFVIYIVRFIAVSLMVSLFLKYSKKSHSSIATRDNRNEVPNVRGWPFLGIATLIRKTKWAVKGVPPQTYTLQAINGIHKFFQHLNFGVVHFNIGRESFYFFSTPEKVEKILRNYQVLDKSSFYDFLLPWLGNGLISGQAIRWKKDRRMLTPAFHFKVLGEFQPMICEKSRVLVSILKTQLDKEFIDVEPFLANYTMDVICHFDGGPCVDTAMGTDIDVQRKIHSPYVLALKRLARLTFKRMVTFYLWNEFTFKWSATGKEYYKCLRQIDSFVNVVIEDRIATLSKSETFKLPENNEKLMKEAKTEKMTFLDTLIWQHLFDPDSLSKDDIRDQVHTFMFAGQDTTEVALTWAIFLLGNYPEAQDQLYNEIQHEFGLDKSSPLTIENFKNMPYLDAVIKETLRLYPSVPFIGRKTHCDIEIDGLLIRKGTTCGIAVQYLHRNEHQFPDPERFIPERFLEENSSGRHPYAYVPFSAGPRNCIGKRFALLEEKSAIVNIVRNFSIRSLDTVDKIPTCPELVARPARPIRVVLTPRK